MNTKLAIFVVMSLCVLAVLQSSQADAKKAKAPAVTIATDKTVYSQDDAINVTISFTNSTTRTMHIFGPFMHRSLGACASFTVDGHLCMLYPVGKFETDNKIIHCLWETPGEMDIKPHDSTVFKRVLKIQDPYVVNGEKIFQDGRLSKGKHRLKYTYVFFLREKDAPIFKIDDLSLYWQGELKSNEIEIEIE